MQQVIQTFQRLSHSCRAFIWNANGLSGFLIKEEPVLWNLKLAVNNEEIKNIAKWHIIDMDNVFIQIREKENSEERLKFLKEQGYICLYMHVLKAMRRSDELQ